MYSRAGLIRKTHGFEGGQMPLVRRLPKRGFNNKRFRGVRPASVNVGLLNAFPDGARVDLAALKEKGLVRRKETQIKLLGMGRLRRKLTVVAHAFSEAARARIEEAGGHAEVVAS